MVGVTAAENSPAGPFGLVHGITLGPRQVLQMASPGSVRLRCQLLFLSHSQDSPHSIHAECSGSPGNATEGFLVEVAF